MLVRKGSPAAFSEAGDFYVGHCRGADSRARRSTYDLHRLPIKTYQPIASVAALPERLWQLQLSGKYRRPCNVPKFVIARPQKGRGDLAVPGRITQEGSGEIATASPRLHPKGTSSRFALRAPRCFAPCNDTSGWCGCGNGAQRRIGTAFAASRTGRACPAPAMAYRYRRFSILRSHRSMPNDTAALRTARTRIMASVLR